MIDILRNEFNTIYKLKKQMDVLLTDSNDTSEARIQQIQESFKKMQVLLYKYSKLVDKQFKYTESSNDTVQQPTEPGKVPLMDQIIQSHFIASGKFNLAHQFAQESNLPVNDVLLNQLGEMFTIVSALEKQDTLPCFQWVQRNKLELDRINSPLEFQLVKLEYMALLQAMNIKQCIAYAKTHFPSLAKYNIKGKSWNSPHRNSKIVGCHLVCQKTSHVAIQSISFAT